MFDFDELDRVEAAVATDAQNSVSVWDKSQEVNDDGDEDDDGISEVFPDDLPCLLQISGDVPAASAEVGNPGESGGAGVIKGWSWEEAAGPGEDEAELEEWAQWAQQGDSRVVARPWEVIFARVVVRAEPRFDAPVVGICSHSELVFEDAGQPEVSGEWVKLVGSLGYILKDGRVKDPKLGLLLRPYRLPPGSAAAAAPSASRKGIFRHLHESWIDSQGGHKFLKPGEIRRLRRATDEALVEATGAGNSFDVGAFGRVLTAKIRDSGAGGGTQCPLPSATLGTATAGALTACPAGPGGTLSGGAGGPALRSSGTAWDHEFPRLLGREVTSDYCRQLRASMKQRSLPCVEDVAVILQQAVELCASLPSLTELHIVAPATLHVVGDLHGQYWDLLQLLEDSGEPSGTNMYLFNGDLVDRGQFSVEVALAVLTMKLAAPSCVHVNRGNHEAVRMNALFGFQAEVRQKYGEATLGLFTQAFRCLPVASVINDSVFVVHGGLSSRPGLRLSAIASLERRQEPEEAEELMVELLWSDPMESLGRERSPRGGGILFGPDITRSFCEDNDLLCVIRSHEMKPEGFEWHHEGRCLTVFSAANYCGVCGNDGAVCDIKPRRGTRRLEASDLKLRTFEASPHPHERGPLSNFGFGFGFGLA